MRTRSSAVSSPLEVSETHFKETHPAVHIAEILLLYFSYLDSKIFHVIMVCRAWAGPARELLFNRVYLSSDKMASGLLEVTQQRPEIRGEIYSLHVALSCHSLPDTLHKLADSGVNGVECMVLQSQNPLKILPRALLQFSGTLCSFAFTELTHIRLNVFCGLLETLAHCKSLKHLTLPVSLVFPVMATHHNTIDGIRTQVRTALDNIPRALQRPSVRSLELLSFSRKRNLITEERALRWNIVNWILHPNCPLDFSLLNSLTIGDPLAAQHLLPAFGPTLLRLEYLTQYDTHVNWTSFGKGCLLIFKLS